MDRFASQMGARNSNCGSENRGLKQRVPAQGDLAGTSRRRFWVLSYEENITWYFRHSLTASTRSSTQWTGRAYAAASSFVDTPARLRS